MLMFLLLKIMAVTERLLDHVSRSYQERDAIRRLSSGTPGLAHKNLLAYSMPSPLALIVDVGFQGDLRGQS